MTRQIRDWTPTLSSSQVLLSEQGWPTLVQNPKEDPLQRGRFTQPTYGACFRLRTFDVCVAV